jgi:hypothetical protein
MKKRRRFKSIEDIRIARERLTYENKFYFEKLKNTASLTVPSLTLSFKNLGLSLRNSFFGFTVVRSILKSNLVYNIARRFSRKFKKAAQE